MLHLNKSTNGVEKDWDSEGFGAQKGGWRLNKEDSKLKKARQTGGVRDEAN